MPKASVVIRTLNEAASLPRVLRALNEQNVCPLEVIVVDSGSRDGTLQIAREAGCRIIEIAPQSFTYGYALNRGLAEACGEVGISLAGHAIPLGHDWLAELLAPLTDPQVAGSASRQVSDRVWQRSYAMTLADWMYRQTGWRTAAAVRMLFTNAASAIRLAVWRQTPFDESLASCEDQLWTLLVNSAGYRLAYCPAAVVNHSHPYSAHQKLACVWRDFKAMRRVRKLANRQIRD
ncbi:MAG: glycosyltransferase family 2 protein [Chloroflexi bacterium]|nr:glycosyltransferase family 2 protein [Chloroflexota bacterium]